MSTPRVNHSDRISALEEGYKGLGREIGGLRDDFQLLARELRHSQKTQWAPLIAAASVVVAIIGGIITLGAQGPLTRLERLDHYADRTIERFEKINEKAATRAELKELEQRRQREVDMQIKRIEQLLAK